MRDAAGPADIHDRPRSPRIAFAEYWTLAKHDGGWRLVSIEQDAEGTHHLTDEIVASPWSDSRLHDEALVEQAVADRVPEGFSPADAASFDFAGSAREEALDLSLADARFLPDVLEAAVRRAAAAWAEAVDGEDAALERVASPEAIDALLYGADAQRRTRLVVRGPRIERVVIERVDAQAQPARMTLDRRRPRPALPRGPRHRRGGLRLARPRGGLRGALGAALDGPDDAPWRVVGVAARNFQKDHQGRLHREQWARLGRAPLVAGMAISLADPGGPDRDPGGVHRGAAGPCSRPRGSGNDDATSGRPSAKTSPRRPINPTNNGPLQAQGPIAGEQILDELRAVNALLVEKTTPEEADQFREWLKTAAQRAAKAAKEGGFLGFRAELVSEREQQMLDRLAEVFYSDGVRRARRFFRSPADRAQSTVRRTVSLGSV